MGLDRIQLTGLGLAVGHIDASQAEATTLYALTADYGEVARHWRFTFGVTFWESRLSDDVVTAFLDTLRGSVDDPTGDYTLVPSTVSLYDLTFGVGVRWLPPVTRWAKPYLDVGLATHVINAEGKLIESTFVERALDNIAAGFFAGAGVEVRPFRSLSFDAQVRADLLSGFRSLQGRVGAMYYLGPLRRLGP